MILPLLGENGIGFRISYVKHTGTLTTRPLQTAIDKAGSSPMLWVIRKIRLFKQSWLASTRWGQGLLSTVSVCNGLLVKVLA
jgi:hypothetical protein